MHPILGDNLRQAFPDLDANNLPPEFARFERIERPVPGMFEVVSEEPEYQWVDGWVRDVWVVRPMTPEEELVKREALARSLSAYKDFVKGECKKNAEASQTEEAKQAWLAYADTIAAWVPEDIANWIPPQAPRIAADGTVLTTNAPGSAPNVVG